MDFGIITRGSLRGCMVSPHISCYVCWSYLDNMIGGFIGARFEIYLLYSKLLALLYHTFSGEYHTFVRALMTNQGSDILIQKVDKEEGRFELSREKALLTSVSFSGSGFCEYV